MGSQQQGADAFDGRWIVIPRTLCFVTNGDDVLLMRRAPHKRVFPNQYNGLGGHIERNEDPMTSARREILEEAGIDVRELRLRAVYNIDAGSSSGIILFVFTGISDTRVVSENSEGTLHWVNKSQIHELDLVEDIPVILPRVLAMRDTEPPLFVHVSYDSEDVIQLHFAETEEKPGT